MIDSTRRNHVVILSRIVPTNPPTPVTIFSFSVYTWWMLLLWSSCPIVKFITSRALNRCHLATVPGGFLWSLTYILPMTHTPALFSNQCKSSYLVNFEIGGKGATCTLVTRRIVWMILSPELLWSNRYSVRNRAHESALFSTQKQEKSTSDFIWWPMNVDFISNSFLS